MIIIVILVFLMLITLFSVAAVNRIQLRQRERRLRQRKLRVEAEHLAEIVNCLETILSNAIIAKHVNDMIIALQQEMLDLETHNRDHLEAKIHKSESRSEELMASRSAQPRYQRDSDAQIAKTQLHLSSAVELTMQLAAQGTINDTELDTYLNELRWASLMVSVMSYIAQGDKSMTISDRLSAHAFYRKAQQLLMESMHPDQRRLRMIKELSELIDGERTSLSPELRDAPTLV